MWETLLAWLASTPGIAASLLVTGALFLNFCGGRRGPTPRAQYAEPQLESVVSDSADLKTASKIDLDQKAFSDSLFGGPVKERVAAQEQRGRCIEMTRAALDKSKWPDHDESRKDMITARVLGRMLKVAIEEERDSLLVIGLDEKPTKFVDGGKMKELIESRLAELLQEEIEAVSKMSDEESVVPFKVVVKDDIGPRPKMEDAAVSFPFLNVAAGNEILMHFVGVFDGHGGEHTAKYVASHLPINLATSEEMEEGLSAGIIDSFLTTNEQYFSFCEREGVPGTMGSTAVAALIMKDKVVVAWAGDSEAALYRKGEEAIPCCDTHKPGKERERERIEQYGGEVVEIGGNFRVCGALAVSRAFGDARFRMFITSEPDMASFDLDGREEFMVVACDGLWDVMTYDDVGKFIRDEMKRDGATQDSVVKELVDEARSLGSTDNITAAVVFFDAKAGADAEADKES